jgi:hypothetical protein
VPGSLREGVGLSPTSGIQPPIDLRTHPRWVVGVFLKAALALTREIEALPAVFLVGASVPGSGLQISGLEGDPTSSCGALGLEFQIGRIRESDRGPGL